MENLVFEKRVSKGSRFNQIYIPREMEGIIEVGDLMQIRLLEKNSRIYYKNQKKLSEFKEYLIKEIFYSLQTFKEIKRVFIIGSFLRDIIYNDIDIIISVGKQEDGNRKNGNEKNSEKNLERKIEEFLTKKFNQKFHILLFNEEKLEKLIKIDPLTKVMLNNYISNKDIKLVYKKIINKKHIKFLLMMPEDLLEINLSSKIFYNNLQRLIAIERFLKNMSLDIKNISFQLEKELDIEILNKIKDNKEINKKEKEILRKKIKKKISDIRGMLREG